MTVLVVDDTSALVHLYEAWLSEDYAVRSAYDGEEALRKVDDAVDTVLLDRQMPSLSGEEVAARIRERDLDCRIVFVSSLDPDSESMAVAPDEYLVKPATRTELLDVVTAE